MKNRGKLIDREQAVGCKRENAVWVCGGGSEQRRKKEEKTNGLGQQRSDRWALGEEGGNRGNAR